jgi:NAD(P)-dependent dehydrogenase (short-subunit alcohol dehydrogenase family)
MSSDRAAERPDLTGRIALVTGASRGIGAAIALRLARAGAAVALTARTVEAAPDAALSGSLGATRRAVEASGGRALAVPADLADADDRTRVVPLVESELGPVDVLVNNAAAAIYAPVVAMPLRRRRLLFEINAHAPVDLAQQVLPGMRDRGKGWIVNISSATARHPDARSSVPMAMGTTTTPYGASKAALDRFSTGLAAEVYEDGIAVNVLEPVTGVRTDGAEIVMAGQVDTSGFEPVEHMAEAALYLASCSPEACSGRVVASGPLLREIGWLV